MGNITEIEIKGFHPLCITLPEGKTLQGKIRLTLPEVHVQVIDLSMGLDLLKGAHLGSDVPMFGLNMEFPDPVDVGKFMLFVIESADTLEKMWRLAQEELNKKGALLG